MHIHASLPISATIALAMMTSVPAAAGTDVLTHEAPTTRQAIARGVLADGGHALTSADVVAVAWPNQKTLLTLKQGDVVPTYVIGRTKTDARGGFNIDADPAALPASFRGAGDQVDVELVFGDARRESRWNYTVERSGRRAAQWVLSGEESHGPDFRGDLGRRIGYDLSSDPAQWLDASGKAGGRNATAGKLAVLRPGRDFSELRGTSLSTLRARRLAKGRITEQGALLAAKGSVPGLGCVTYAGLNHYGLPERFMQVYGWAGARATVHQDYGNDHTLGVGLSTNAKGTSFTQSGTKTLNVEASAERSGVVDANVYNRVNYRDYYNTCSPHFERRPVSMNSLLTDYTFAPHPRWASCSRYTGGVYRKAKGTNVTYSSGMDIGPVSVSAKSGWDVNTEIVWTITKPTMLCGSSRDGWARSARAEAHAG